MANSKNTKRALLTSALAILACVAMLIGTTFAWFTDTASTAVNKIVSGKLDVALEMWNGEKWVSAEGITLNFLKAKEAEGEKILWEPGCTYELPQLRIVNNGTLALKYKIQISGIQGNAKLNEVINWTINDAAIDLTEGHLAAGQKGAPFTIKGQMQTTAGNDYQNLSIDGIGITVVAAQDTVENDSYGPTYDEDAEYPTITAVTTIEEAFPDVNFRSDSTNTEPIVLDGKGVTVVENWADYYFGSDTTIKGVTFKNGASFTVKSADVTITLEDCTFYACDQQKAAAALGITDDKGTGNNGRNNILTNTGAGMCLNLEQVKTKAENTHFVVKNCTFVGENDNTLSAEGLRYNANGSVDTIKKKRGHAIGLNAISGGGNEADSYSLLVEGCTINGVRGNAIQLYGTKGDITIKDTKVNSWAVNNTGVGYAVRGDFDENGSRTLTLTNVYFGLDEVQGNTEFGHVKVGHFTGNTNGTETAGTYSK